MIYALNTKNDEHEEEIESLKEAHEDEVWAQQTQKSASSYLLSDIIWSHAGSTNQYSSGAFVLYIYSFLKYL